MKLLAMPTLGEHNKSGKQSSSCGPRLAFTIFWKFLQFGYKVKNSTKIFANNFIVWAKTSSSSFWRQLWSPRGDLNPLMWLLGQNSQTLNFVVHFSLFLAIFNKHTRTSLHRHTDATDTHTVSCLHWHTHKLLCFGLYTITNLKHERRPHS